MPADVSQAAHFTRVGEQATAYFGGVDCLFNNAGIESAVAPLLDDPEEAFDRVLAAIEAGNDPAAPEAVKQRFIAGVPMQRYGRPEEVAAVVAFLCSADAS